MPGNHIHDHQMRLFMKLKLSKTLPAAAAQAGISVATAYRFGHDPRLSSDKKAPRASPRCHAPEDREPNRGTKALPTFAGEECRPAAGIVRRKRRPQ